jgi:hypothetical protein
LVFKLAKDTLYEELLIVVRGDARIVSWLDVTGTRVALTSTRMSGSPEGILMLLERLINRR